MGRRLAIPGIQAAILGLLVFATYLRTSAPGLMYTDSGELAAACTTFGVAHPTGYPLFTLLGHVWTMMAWGSPVAALNVLAGLWVASSVGVAFLLILDVLEWVNGKRSDNLHTIVAAASSLMLGWSATVWSQATSIEVYALHLLLTTTTLLFVVRSVRPGPNAQQWSLLSGLFYGLMLANHLSSIFLAPGLLLLWLAGTEKPRVRMQEWTRIVIPALLGVALYAVLPLRSAQEPLINWGFVHRGLDAFLYHVKGTQFGGWLYSGEKAFSTNLSLFWKLLTGMVLWVGLIPVALGIGRTFSAQRRLALGLVAVVLGNLGIALGYAIPDIEPYFLPTFVVVAVAFAIGATHILKRVPTSAQWVAFAFPTVILFFGWKEQDLTEHTAVPDYTQWVLANAEPNAVIITRQWDYFCSAVWYLQTVEHQRMDVTVIDKELLRRTWYAPYLLQRHPNMMKNVQQAVDAYMPYLELFESNSAAFNKNQKNVQMIQARFVELLNAFVRNNPDRPVYITPELINEEAGFADGYLRLPAGPLVRLVRDTIAYRQRQSTDGLQRLVTSLAGRKDRLDVGLRQNTLTVLGTMAMYQLDGFSDTLGFRRYRDLARLLDGRNRITRQLDAVIP